MRLKKTMVVFAIPSVFLGGKWAFPGDGTELLNNADLAKLQGNLNYLWVLLAATLVFFMQAGFMCLESGLAKAKNSNNTILSASFGCLSASVLSWINSPVKRPRGEMIANGVISGLVGITAGCASVEPDGAAIIGLISGCIAYSGMRFNEKYLKIDDVVGAISVHGFCGVWGTIAAGIFITPEQLGDVSRSHQIFVQCIGVATCFIWAFGTAYLILYIINRFLGGMRVSKEDEASGLNISEHGARSTLHDLTESMQRATRNQDFSERVKVNVEIGTEFSDLCHGFNQMVEAIQKALKQTRRQIQTAERAKRDAETAQSDLVERRREFDDRIKEIAKNLGNMMNEIEITMSLIGRAAGKVQSAVKALSGKSEDIDTVLASVEKIAFSTKLLATNAMIQAAHAGEAGVGFSVVASQMGEVAQNTREASDMIGSFTREIKLLFQNVVNSINDQFDEIMIGKKRLDSAGKMIKELIPDHMPSTR